MNISALGVSHGDKILVASPNTHALRAFTAKLPKNLQPLCLDLSSCEIDGMVEFSKALEDMLYYLSDVKNHMAEYQSNIAVRFFAIVCT